MRPEFNIQPLSTAQSPGRKPRQHKKPQTPGLQLALTILTSLLIFAAPHSTRAQQYMKGCYEVKKDGKHGLINKKGNIVLPIEYDELKSNTIGVWFLKQAGKTGLADSDGNLLLATAYDTLNHLRDQIFLVGKNKRESLYFRKEKKLHPEAWDKLIIGSRTTFFVMNRKPGAPRNKDLSKMKEGKLTGMIANDGQVLVPMIFDELRYMIVTELAPGQTQGSRWLKASQNGRWGLWRVGDTLRIPCEYDDIRFMEASRLKVQKSGKTGLIDTTGKVLIPLEYDELERFQGNNFYLVTQNGRKGIYKLDAGIIIEPEWVSFGNIDFGFLKAERHMKKALCHLDHGVILPNRFSTIKALASDRVVGRNAGKDTLFDGKGKVLAGVPKGEYQKFDHGASVFKVKRSFGVIDREGKILLPAEQKQVQIIGNVLRYQDQKKKWHTMALKGSSGRKKFVLRRKNEAVDLTRSASFSTGTISPPTPIDPRLGSVNWNPGNWFLDGTSSLWGYRDTITKSVKIPPRFREITPIRNTDLAVVKERRGRYLVKGLVRISSGEILLEPRLKELNGGQFQTSALADGKLINGRQVRVHNTGMLITDPNITYVGPMFNGLATASLGGQSVPKNEKTMRSLNQLTGNGTYNTYLEIEKGKWGLIGRNGKWAVEPRYDYMKFLDKGVLAAETDGMWQILDSNLKARTELIWTEFRHLPYVNDNEVPVEDKMLIGYGPKNATGYINEAGDIFVAPKYGKGTAFRDGYGKVAVVDTSSAASGRGGRRVRTNLPKRQTWLYGFVNREGKEIVPPKYKDAGDWSEGRGAVKMGRNWSWVDESGNLVIENTFSQAGDFHEGMAWAMQNRRYGFVDPQGQWVIEPKYLEAGDFQHGMALVRTSRGRQLINQEGKKVGGVKLSAISVFQKGYALFTWKGRKGILDSSGKVIMKPKFKRVQLPSEGYLWADAGSGYQLYNLAGKRIISNTYQDAGPIQEGRAIIKTKNQWFYISLNGDTLSKPDRERAPGFREGVAPVYSYGNCWYIDSLGNTLEGSTSRLKECGCFFQGLARVQRDGYWFYINKELVPVTETNRFVELSDFQQGYGLGKSSSGWWIINPDGSIRNEVAYQDKPVFRENTSAMRFPKRIGLLRTNGSVILPALYDEIDVKGTLIRVIQGKKVGWMSPAGNWIWPTQE